MKSALLLTIIGVLIALAACSTSAAPAPAAAVGVEAKEFEFSPQVIEVMAETRVHLTLRNMGTLDHDFSVSVIPVEIHSASEPVSAHEMHGAPQLHVAVVAGQEGFVEFTATEPGTYQFYCSVSGHKEGGMTGTLIVNPP